MADWYRWQGKTLLLSVKVQPRASRDEIVGPHGDEGLKVRITAPPVEGKANQHLVRYLAKAFGVAKSRVTLLRGETGREKKIAIDEPGRLPDAAKIDVGPAP
jgi:uncharacterized protein (TIGR00251 family)